MCLSNATPMPRPGGDWRLPVREPGRCLQCFQFVVDPMRTELPTDQVEQAPAAEETVKLSTSSATIQPLVGTKVES